MSVKANDYYHASSGKYAVTIYKTAVIKRLEIVGVSNGNKITNVETWYPVSEQDYLETHLTISEDKFDVAEKIMIRLKDQTDKTLFKKDKTLFKKKLLSSSQMNDYIVKIPLERSFIGKVVVVEAIVYGYKEKAITTSMPIQVLQLKRKTVLDMFKLKPKPNSMKIHSIGLKPLEKKDTKL